MLYIMIEDCYADDIPEGYVSAISGYFDNNYEPEWFQDSFVRKIIKHVDDSVVCEGYGINIYNEVLGNIPPQNLSNGCKALILLYSEDGIKVDGDRLGDNCIDLLLEIAERKDIDISLSHTPPFPSKFDAVIVNNGKRISTRREWVVELLKTR